MKSSNKKRSNGRRGRFNNNNNRRSSGNIIGKNTVIESNGPVGHIRGTASQLAERYLAAVKEARHQGDHILSELCSQQAEHFTRLANQAALCEKQSKEETFENTPATSDAPKAEEIVTADETSDAKVDETPQEETGTKPKRRRLFVRKKQTDKTADEPTNEPTGEE